MGISSSNNLLSEQWTEVIKNMVRSLGIGVREESLLKSFLKGNLKNTKQEQEFLTFIKSTEGKNFISQFESRVATMVGDEKKIYKRVLNDLKSPKSKVTPPKTPKINNLRFETEWAKVKSDSGINKLFSKYPEAKDKIKPWLESNVQLGKSFDDIGADVIKSHIRSVVKKPAMLDTILKYSDKLMSTSGGKLLLLTAVGGVLVGAWNVSDLWEYLKSRFKDNETPTPDNNNSPVEDPDNGGEANW
jgi:hypothetical protein